MAETCGASSLSCLDRMQNDSFISALYFFSHILRLAVDHCL